MQNNTALSNNKRKFLFAIIGLLVGLNIFLWFMNQRMNTEHKKLKAKTVEIENTKENLQKAYNTALADLDTYKGENIRLDSLLSNNKSEMELLKAEIQELLNKDKLTTSELGQAKTMIVNLKLRNQNQVNTLDSLFSISQSLARTNLNLEQDLKSERDYSEKITFASDSLKVEYDSLSRTAEKLDVQRTEAQDENKELKSKNEQLLEKTEDLSKKVDKAAMLKLENINFEGIRFRKNGKDRKTKDFNKVERFRICYQVEPNEFADSGSKELYLKVTNPEGLVLYDETNDSPGYFTNNNDGKIQYSSIANLDYKNNELQEFCTFCGFTAPLIQGIYEVELFYKGEIVGMDQLELKNTLF